MPSGSWHHAFHTLEAYYVLSHKRTPYDMVSPFTSEAEAMAYEKATLPKIIADAPLPKAATKHNDLEMLQAAQTIARYSYDYNFQTGVSLGKKQRKAYAFLTAAWNKIVPFQTYALHHGAARERYFSPPHDLNHYDTVHAEVELVIKAAQEGIDLADTTVFINLLPCPACSRMLADTPIKELVYRADHSNGYAIKMLEQAGKTVRRLVV
nr:Cytidine and deoxycytidylate deaminase zinc-binding region [uncultured bacterium]